MWPPSRMLRTGAAPWLLRIRVAIWMLWVRVGANFLERTCDPQGRSVRGLSLI